MHVYVCYIMIQRCTLYNTYRLIKYDIYLIYLNLTIKFIPTCHNYSINLQFVFMEDYNSLYRMYVCVLYVYIQIYILHICYK